jgi:hypothetical protein
MKSVMEGGGEEMEGGRGKVGEERWEKGTRVEGEGKLEKGWESGGGE